MDYDRAIISAANGKAILFVGAGFSVGATALNGSGFPTGSHLARLLCEEASAPVSDDLKTASSRYLRKKRPDELIKFLRENYSSKVILEKQEIVASIPWKAIYTTNYDDILELGAKAKGKKLSAVTLADHPRSHRDSNSYVVHINGYIDRLNENTLLNEFKLTNTSYLTNQFRESEWCDLFLHHLRSSHAIFFVGYSLYDIDIQEIFHADKSLYEKTFFIQRENMTEEDIYFSELADFGTILPIGIDKFSKDLSQIDPLALSTDKSLMLTGLEEMTLPEAIATSTAADIYNLLLRGDVNSDFISEQIISGAQNSYIFNREGVDTIDNKIDNYMVIGDIGNGKTTMLRCICANLIKIGKRCFWLKDESYDSHDEIDAILKLDEPSVIVFDNYTKKLNLIEYANLKRRSDTILVFSARTLLHKNSQEDLYYKKIRIDVTKTFEINCNKLTDSELTNLVEYFLKYGVWGDMTGGNSHKKIRYIRKVCNSELHGVLLDLLASPEMQSRFSNLFREFKGSKQITKALVATFTLNLLNITHPNAHMIAAITGDGTIFTPSFKSNEILKHFFNSEQDIITPKSAALAEFCMKNFPDPVLLVECLIDICKSTRKKAATERKFDMSKFYWDLYRDMASFSSVKRMLPEVGKRELLIQFYEGLRTIDLERENPLFWLQYAMARMNQPMNGDLEQAAIYLRTAMSIAKSKKGFTTTDIETQQARLYIEYALHSAETATEAYDFFVQADARLAKITKDEIYKTEPYRPIHNYTQLFIKFGSDFSITQCRGIYDSCSFIMHNIKVLPIRIAEEQVIVTARRVLQDIMNKLSLRLAGEEEKSK
ncbi:SIR2 family protein [Janthinobacterium sp. 64]|uniref:SIR2 family protein n=1 Tax=Janthinobacterium sp. 64 TaxID=2035208 RepID=UPI000C2C4B7A|nr:SIR2 family protein [Janthinobacterium sp. 64]PKB20327.1 SIR2-like protein [Janthinobacterium sp. 64]